MKRQQNVLVQQKGRVFFSPSPRPILTMVETQKSDSCLFQRKWRRNAIYEKVTV